MYSKTGFFPKFCPDSISSFQSLPLVMKVVKDKKGVFGRFLPKTHTALSISCISQQLDDIT
jgi:hypothetical protein